MEWHLDTDPLLVNRPHALGWWALPVCMACSSLGMMILKRAQAYTSLSWLIVGYALEAIAFGVYPLAMKAHSLRIVVTMWAASSTLTALIGVWVLYEEVPSRVSAIGCVVVVCGVCMVSS